MTLTPSHMIELGTMAPQFSLPDTDGNLLSLSDLDSHKGLLVIFMCNHCPYVRHIRQALAAFADKNMSSDFAMIGINSNDAKTYPADSPQEMAAEAKAAGYHFPYLYDESQNVAKAYGAKCTPDFFLYNASRALIYRGQFDASRPGNDIPASGVDLQVAVNALLEDREVSREQVSSVGCSIKWKAGNAPD
jgi:peroxiredoxin